MRGIRDEETRQRVLEALRAASSVSAAAKAAGTSRTVVYRWAERDPEVQAAIDQIQARRKQNQKAHREPFGSPPTGSSPPDRAPGELEDALAEAKRNGDVVLGLEVLREIAQNDECRPAARVAAAKELIKLGLSEEARKRWDRPNNPPATSEPSPAPSAGEGEAEPPAPLNLEAAKKKLLGG